MIVADTDVLIDYLAGKNPVADRIAVELSHGQLATTVISRFELLCGAKTPRQRKAVEDLLQGMGTLALDKTAADLAADVRRGLEKKGEGIGLADSLIAGIVLRHSAIFLTRNRDHFSRVPGLSLGRFTLDEAPGW